MKYKIINSDVFAGIYFLENDSIDVAITSPPYWGQRDYGFEGQIGNEKTPQEYILKLVKIFSLLKEKMTKEGVFFLNIGDKYISKYGKAPLGFIPYQLAYFMVNDGWFLNDILIWYKPNHMPSSIKNRFTNSYEPVFVFSKSKDNIFKKNINPDNYSNILKINLQPTLYRHVAVFPEKLVEELLNRVILKEDSLILDPFAGSGTTMKVVLDKSQTLQAIMIEKNIDYIDIIKKRCKLNNFEILKYDFIPYYYEKKNFIPELDFSEEKFENFEVKFNGKGIFELFDNKNDYMKMLNLFFTNSIKNHLKINATCYIGSTDFDLDLIYKTSLLNNRGWVIRNMIVVEKNNNWFPIFMIVDDNKKTNYIFNYKKLKLKSKTEFNRDWNLTNFLGYRVINSIDKVKKEGKVIKICSKRNNGFPEYLIVHWEDGSFSKEFVIYSQEEINNNLIIRDNFEIEEIKNFIDINKNIDFKQEGKNYEIYNHNKNYNGKYKNEKRVNWGASPGARSSVENEYFSVQRLYEVNQNIIADYLNYKRILKGFSKKELTNLFPKEYKHTVGHWLRKDFGGSLPTITDWFKLVNILDIDEKITNYVCKTALKIQTVRNSEFKTPDDFININNLHIFEELL
ncbi:MAG TPA: site-specific DNA-methyltransferase [Bacteroidales bacterium]|nr:site-specific DNA-methyltransferase [Bacteroidales bacterium]HOM40463.1 site-specific DNA-methyltransferase [Bacteroidales bacterium]HQK71187.1 site-specific DNA-methyltransferase [Bacteroidales bacterium]